MSKRFTLVTDGSSDRVLEPILGWLIGQMTSTPFVSRWAELRGVSPPPRHLSDRIAKAVDLYPCDLLFVHRDAEREKRAHRVEEIRRARDQVEDMAREFPVVCVVPIRMQEAWLLFDQAALRRAAGCPNGATPLELPSLERIEREPDPKYILHDRLRLASNLKGRRAKEFDPRVCVHRLALLIDDFSPLRRLSAFRALEADLAHALEALGCPLNV